MEGKGSLQDKTQIIRSGMDELCSISKKIYEENNPYLHARFELIMGLGLLFNGDNMLAVCFLNASRRKWDTMDEFSDLPRKTSVYYNLGLAFSTMEGLSSKTTYIKAAIEHLEYSKRLFNKLRDSEREYTCDIIINNLKHKHN
jgi:hypothetical protein